MCQCQKSELHVYLQIRIPVRTESNSTFESFGISNKQTPSRDSSKCKNVRSTAQYAYCILHNAQYLYHILPYITYEHIARSHNILCVLQKGRRKKNPKG